MIISSICDPLFSTDSVAARNAISREFPYVRRFCLFYQFHNLRNDYKNRFATETSLHYEALQALELILYGLIRRFSHCAKCQNSQTWLKFVESWKQQKTTLIVWIIS